MCVGRTQAVFGMGARRARWMVIGEAPGLDEDRDGDPCAGKAGELLTAMLRACGVQRDEVFLTNVLKCRPLDNREPEAAEVAECLPYLLNQMALVQPELVICLGRAPAQYLLGTDLPLAKLRGQVHHLQSPAVPVVVTYHPTYLLRAPQDKRKAWEDLQLAMAQVPPLPAAQEG
jgi:DNA polymerase